jgi:hypothetical protein
LASSRRWQVIDSPDYYGNKNGGGFPEWVVAQEAAAALKRCSGSVRPIDIAIMIDKGLLTSEIAAVSAINAKAIRCAAPASPPAAGSAVPLTRQE